MEEQNQTNQNFEQEPQIEQEYNPVPHEELIEDKKNWKLIIAIIILILVVLGGGLFWWNQNQNTEIVNAPVKIEEITEKTEEEVVNLEEEKDIASPEDVFADFIIAAQDGDIDTYFSLAYSSDSVINAYTAYFDEPNSSDMLDMIMSQKKDEMQSKYNNFEYTIDNISIEDKEAILTVNATKNSRDKKTKYIYMLKDNNTWKINAYGFNHPADSVGNSKSECNTTCNIMSLYNDNTQECYCWQDKPSTTNLTHLEIEKCEEMEYRFRGGCYFNYAKEIKNEEYCEKVGSFLHVDCYNALATLKKEVGICDNLWDDEKCLYLVENPEDYEAPIILY